MNAPETFTKEQQAYLQGLVLGTDVARTIRQLPVLSGSLGSKELLSTVLQVGGKVGPSTSHLSAMHLEAQQRFEASGKQLVTEEKAKREKNGLGMWEEIGRRSASGEFPKGTDLFLTKFCGLFYVAPAQDSYMCRMRLPGGVLRAEQLRGVAELADDCAGGFVDVTTRANLQLREIPAGRAMDVLSGLRDLGIVTTGAGADNVRNVTCSTLSGIDSTELIETLPLAKELHYHILHKPELYGLPRKFNIAFDGGGQISCLAETNDVSWQAVRVEREVRSIPKGIYFLLGLGGITGHGDFARSTGVLAAPSECVPLCEAILRVFIRNGDRTDRKKARLKYLLDDWGFEKFLNEVEKEYKAPIRRVEPRDYVATENVDRWAHVDVHRQKQLDRCYVGVICPVGRLTSTQCRGLAAIAGTFGNGTLRLTVWQNIILPHIPTEDVPRVLEEISALGLEWERNSVRAGLVACTGSAGCKYAGADTKRNAQELATYLEDRIELDQPVNIHFTGCHHSCAQHAIGDIGLIATKVEWGDEVIDGYHILLGGRTGFDHAIATKVLESVPENGVPAAVERILRLYLEHRNGVESFADFSKTADWLSLLSEQRTGVMN
ncbi:Sulfite reductase [Pirellula sp. SH-Sr6A]|uniref:NirA family protein n=1 Tax=Pirellula sp. SH-Sr6A TaxID=1632865 RepID=UPI00078EB0A1|nr:NirA family protein [Pirellula sp. SH-Sr6A]AMV34835.1 Sulfite reductase [Pirellula sp. SH-Sr6A]